ncbi:MAG: YkgJ family cysteine cluster protein [Campylobacteraceae bacterium]|nr:YkgJ family cysteine cluster protein [Campylobacteraceae bacterium]
MKNFVSIENKSFSFSSCDGCGAKCCSGLYGSNFSELTIDEFEKVYKHFVILFSFSEMGYLKANLIISRVTEHCVYIKNNICTIYDKRPNVCKNYPLSPSPSNDIYIDTNCPALESGSNIINDGKINPSFHNELFENYQDKFMKSHFYLEKFNKEDFEIALIIRGMNFYKYKHPSSDEYLQMHLESLLLL